MHIVKQYGPKNVKLENDTFEVVLMPSDAIITDLEFIEPGDRVKIRN